MDRVLFYDRNVKMKKYIIPNALQIVIDDLGWFNGKDDRKNGGFTIDVSDVPKARGSLGKFYVSSRDEIGSFDGCDIALYETRADRLVYEITPKSDSITLS